MQPALAVIGAGQLGSRHLQALARLSRPCRIWVVDPIPSALEVAKTRFVEADRGAGNAVVSYHRSMAEIDCPLDVAIVATNSDVRAAAIADLLSRGDVRAMVLEKVLFTVAEDYERIGRLLEQRGVAAWANCARRSWTFYRDLKERLAGSTIREVRASGANWGLGCNAIHYIDLAAWLAGCQSYAVTSIDLEPGTYPAKRSGFVEFSGALRGSFATGPLFSISSWRAGDMPFLLEIMADDLVAVIREDERLAWLAARADGWKWQELGFAPALQSELTHLIVEEILDRGTAPLTPYGESAALHRPMQDAFLTHLGIGGTGNSAAVCPIT